MTDVRLSLRGVRFAYGDAAVLNGIDLDIAASDRLAVIGVNGAGKSTLLRVLAGTLEPDAGSARLDGKDLVDLKGPERARRIAYVPQETHVSFDFTVLEVVLMGRAPWLGLLGVEGKRDLEAAHRALEFTDTAHLASRPISRLSSGERQRVLLARVLAQEPEIVLLDEPTAFLDLGQRVRILRLLEDLNTKRGTTVVFASHDLNLASRYASRVLLMKQGSIAGDGPPASVITPEAVRSAYGVEVLVITHPAVNSPTVIVLGPPGAGAAAPGDPRDPTPGIVPSLPSAEDSI